MQIISSVAVEAWFRDVGEYCLPSDLPGAMLGQLDLTVWASVANVYRLGGLNCKSSKNSEMCSGDSIVWKISSTKHKSRLDCYTSLLRSAVLSS